MKKVSDNILTPNQFMFMLVGSMVGVGALNLPNEVVTIAKQDGWISVIIGIMYPLYIGIMSLLIQKKYPDNNIISVNQILYGKIFGSILNVILASHFLIYLTSVTSGIGIILRSIIVSFLLPLKIAIVIIFLGAYSAYKGLKVLGRANELMFILTIVMLIIPSGVIGRGSLLNFCPVFQSSFKEILKGSTKSAFSYSGIEIILIIYPYISDKTKIKKSTFKSILFVMLLYLWITLICIYRLGVDVIPKYVASFPAVIRYIEVPVINNLRFVFITLWSFIIFKTVSNYYYALSTTINETFFKDKNKYNIICIAIYPIIVYLTTLYKNGNIRNDFLNFVVPKYGIYMIIYTTITATIAYKKSVDI